MSYCIFEFDLMIC